MISDKLKELRTERNITQKEIADFLECSPNPDKPEKNFKKGKTVVSYRKKAKDDKKWSLSRKDITLR